MQTKLIEPIEKRIVDLLKQRSGLNATQISNVLDEDAEVVKNKLTMLLKDRVVFNEPGILEATYYRSPLSDGWVIPTFKEIGKAIADEGKKSAVPAVVVPKAIAPILEDLGKVEYEDIKLDMDENGDTVVAAGAGTYQMNKVDRAIDFLKSKGPGYVASSKELCLAMGLKQYGSAMNVLKYVVKKGIICFHRYTGYWLPTAKDAVMAPVIAAPQVDAPPVVTSYVPKVDRVIAYLKSKGAGYVAGALELAKVMDLEQYQYQHTENFLRNSVLNGLVCFAHDKGYWLPTEAGAVITPAPRTVKLKQRAPVSLPATTPQTRRVFGEANPDEPESNYKEWLAQSGQDSHTAAAKPKATEVAIEAAAPKHDPIHNPAHYTTGGIEVIDVLKAKLSPEEFRGFLKGNVIKYSLRAEHKNGVQDYAKGAKYAEWLAESKPQNSPSLKPVFISPNVDLRALRTSVVEGYKASSATMLDLIDFALQHHQST